MRVVERELVRELALVEPVRPVVFLRVALVVVRVVLFVRFVPFVRLEPVVVRPVVVVLRPVFFAPVVREVFDFAVALPVVFAFRFAVAVVAFWLFVEVAVRFWAPVVFVLRLVMILESGSRPDHSGTCPRTAYVVRDGGST